MPSIADRLEVDVRELSAAELTPASAYRVLRGCGNGALVENAARGQGSAPHALIALDPIETMVLDADPRMLEKIRATFDRYRLALASPPPGYGLICTFAYDAALVIHGIAARPRANRLFGDAYAFVPGTWLWFDPDAGRVSLAGIFRSHTEQIAVAQRLDEYVRRLSSVRRDTSTTHPSTTRLRRSAQDDGRSAPDHGGVSASLSPRAFLARVAKAQRAIRRGDVYQIVVGVQFSCPYRSDALALYERLSVRNPSPCRFLIEFGGRALVGASPEFLVRLEGRRAELRPLAGTRRRGETAERDGDLAAELCGDAKERAEHVMLVDLGRNDLSRVCQVGSVRVDRALALERYSHVMHLASQVSGRLAEGCDAFDLFGATFPAGTVTGTPKRRAMELIEALEPTPRDAYAGSVAHFRFDGSLDAALTLRSIVLAGDRAIWQAGAGIVHPSDPASEYAEVLAKTRISRIVLGLEEAGVA